MNILSLPFMAKNFKDIVKHYFKRYPDFGISLEDNLPRNIKTIFVIPCFKEPEILKTLDSLIKCETPNHNTLVLILVNASENAPQEIKDFNKKTFDDIQLFISKKECKNLYFRAILKNNLPAKHAGVGYARKTLMDSALKIFETQNHDGVIVNTDADCLFSLNYINSIENTFLNEKIKLAVMHYEHRIEQEKNESIAKGITEYELHLRYYKQALEWTNYPNVLETIGSCMVCRASTYALEGGMNKRKAAEDFYFINKLAKNHVSTTITKAAVLPSCRTSDRVPFGTGKAMNDYIETETEVFQSYDFECFLALKKFVSQIEWLYNNDFKNIELDNTSKAFLNKIDIEQNLINIKKQSNNLNRFINRFFYWFDHLKALQFIHFMTENKFSKIDIDKAALQFLYYKNENILFENTFEILEKFRKNEKESNSRY